MATCANFESDPVHRVGHVGPGAVPPSRAPRGFVQRNLEALSEYLQCLKCSHQQALPRAPKCLIWFESERARHTNDMKAYWY